ncbi:MAG: hypothetical protein Q4F60_02035 [Candidatus Saccharibacteria bacterium]|nr:hypothetical protein [Candidatus Saccharibacteria bacterium]
MRQDFLIATAIRKVSSYFFDGQASILIPLVFVRSGNYNWTSGSLNNRGSNGNYWSRESNSPTNAYNLNFNSTNFNPQNTNNKINGFTVRCVAR